MAAKNGAKLPRGGKKSRPAGACAHTIQEMSANVALAQPSLFILLIGEIREQFAAP